MEKIVSEREGVGEFELVKLEKNRKYSIDVIGTEHIKKGSILPCFFQNPVQVVFKKLNREMNKDSCK